jgi:hypothetical protein
MGLILGILADYSGFYYRLELLLDSRNHYEPALAVGMGMGISVGVLLGIAERIILRSILGISLL